MGLLTPITKREKMMRVGRKLYPGPCPSCKEAVQPLAQPTAEKQKLCLRNSRREYGWLMFF